jgi:hypothetical protein
MSPFASKIRQLINQYKRILKRHLSASTYLLKVKTLHIKRKELKNATDVDLFHISNRVLYDIETWLSNQGIAACEYSGIDEFYRHMKSYTNTFRVDDDKILHSDQQASRAIVESIQLLCLPFNEKNSLRLMNNISLMRRIGAYELLDKLSIALYKKNTETDNLFQPIIQFFEDEQHSKVH